MTTREAARRWAQTWQRAWEALDADPIVALYAPDASFSREPYRRPDGVRAYVDQAFADEEAPRVWTSEPIVDADRAAVSWWASLREDGTEMTLAGTSVLRFDVDGRVLQQWDAWNMADGRREPPLGTPLVDFDT